MPSRGGGRSASLAPHRRPLPPRARPTATALPASPTPLVGRARELGDARARLLGPDVRLLTLTGPGGSGKTRLAVELARGISDGFADGVAFVDLAPVAAPAMVLPTTAQRLGLREVGGRPLARTLADYLVDKQLLLLLDN